MEKFIERIDIIEEEEYSPKIAAILRVALASEKPNYTQLQLAMASQNALSEHYLLLMEIMEHRLNLPFKMKTILDTDPSSGN